ncbi:MAG: translation initiation factor IF-2 subunit alpha [Candidatus Heimdallarchaeota archaeon]|nr:translation initiation factor IF-2 subunit alpha [Candidatus Heimdallarchaeota archaeon]
MSKRTGPKESRLEDDLFDPEAEKSKEQIFEGLPRRNELVVATVRDVMDHGAYVSLDEFGERRAYVHISELSRTWVKNIRVHVREGQRIVAKVLRVDPYKNQIDLSIKRVPDQMRKLKLLESKRGQTANALFNMIIEKMPEEERNKADEIKDILITHHEMLYYGLEFASNSSPKELVDIGIDEKWAKIICKISKENIVAATVEIKGNVEISIPGGNGVETLKEALVVGRDNLKEKNTEIYIYTIGSPRYAIEVISEDYKMAEKALENALERIEDIVTSKNGTFSFERK